jgi:BRCT domain type II-containing protein
MWLNLITTTTATFILSITTPQRSRTITMRIKNIQLITIDCIDWREKKNNISRGEIIKKKKSNNNIFSKCVKGDNKYSVWCMDVR